MGNSNSCCGASSPPVVRKMSEPPAVVGTTADWKHVSSSGSHANLPHISEREPDDLDANPSIHGKAGTIFMERSKASESKLCMDVEAGYLMVQLWLRKMKPKTCRVSLE